MCKVRMRVTCVRVILTPLSSWGECSDTLRGKLFDRRFCLNKLLENGLMARFGPSACTCTGTNSCTRAMSMRQLNISLEPHK